MRRRNSLPPSCLYLSSVCGGHVADLHLSVKPLGSQRVPRGFTDHLVHRHYLIIASPSSTRYQFHYSRECNGAWRQFPLKSCQRDGTQIRNFPFLIEDFETRSAKSQFKNVLPCVTRKRLVEFSQIVLGILYSI